MCGQKDFIYFYLYRTPSNEFDHLITNKVNKRVRKRKRRTVNHESKKEICMRRLRSNWRNR